MSVSPAPHVLVVDDDDDVRFLLFEYLEGDGFRCSEAADGVRAIRMVESGLNFDVILLDYRMPGLSGGETLARLRAAGCKTPCVLLTAAANASELGVHHGFDAVLKKPVGPERLCSTLHGLIGPGDPSS